MTKARVIAYQTFVGLPQTGVADARTQQVLATRGWSKPAAKPTPKPAPKPATPSYPTLSYGMTSTAVRTLQARLGGLPTSGYYGSMTRARVTAYQKFVGLPQTGVADPAPSRCSSAAAGPPLPGRWRS